VSGEPARRSRWWFALLAAAAVAAAFAAYSNHFHNSFHFDDHNVIQNNVYLRSLSNVPLFFKEASTFSSVPTNATYRPLTSVSFALDYWWGKGLNPFAFHLTQWCLHLALAVLIFFFLRRVLGLAGVGPRCDFLSLFGAALFCLHRVNTETLNFLTLRSEILSTLGVVGSFVLFQYAPRWRKSFLWLLPAIAGAFAKQSAIIFAPLFALYLAFFPEEREVGLGPARSKSWFAASRLWIPPFAFSVVFYWLQNRLNGETTVWGSAPRMEYFQTQTFAWLHYVRLFLIPLGQSADSDWTVIPHWYDTRVVAGALFALLLVSIGAWVSRASPLGRAFFFGLLWFFVALVPSSSVFPLSEMINEHRPYLPYIGLILSTVAAIEKGLLWLRQSRAGQSAAIRAVPALGVAVLLAHAFGAHARNEVWATDESLWQDVTEASPGNGRAWMNYGLIFMRRGDYAKARECFENAWLLTPRYDVLEVNMAILEGATNHPAEAEQRFLRALALNQRPSVAHFYYARWLHEQGRNAEAATHLEQAMAQGPADLDIRHLLMTVYSALNQQGPFCSVALDTLRIAPGDAPAAAAARVCREGSARSGRP